MKTNPTAKKRSRIRGLVILLALVLCAIPVLAGCGSTSQSEDGHMNVALYWFGTSLDPAVDYDGWTTCRAGITETLVTVDKNYEIQPLLADKYEQTSDTTWRFHIRKNAKFHNGKKVTGEAVKASFERAMAAQERAKTTAHIDSISADGQYVTFTTTDTYGAFLNSITEPMYSVVDATVSDSQMKKKPIATGPFKVTSFKTNKKIGLKTFKNYWGGASKLDTVTVTMIESDTTRANALQSGEQDAVQRVAASDLSTFQGSDDYTVYNMKGARTRILFFNFKDSTLADANIRKAITNAIDYKSLKSVVGKTVTVSGYPLPSNSPYVTKSLTQQSKNLKTAKAALKAAGYTGKDDDGYVTKDGETLTLKLTYSTSDYKTMCEAIQSMLKNVGIKVTLDQREDTTDIENGESTNYQLYTTNWQTLSTGDPEWFLETAYLSTSDNNYSSYSNSEFDDVVSQLATATTTSERKSLAIEAEQILLDDYASVYLLNENNLVVTNSGVKNILAHPIDYYLLDNNVTRE